MTKTFSDDIAAQVLGDQIAEMRERVQQRGVMAYLQSAPPSSRKDVNKVFLSNTIRSVDLHNQRHEEEKCWKLRELETKIVQRRRSRDRSPRRRRSRSRSPRRRSRTQDRRSRSRSPQRASTHRRRRSASEDRRRCHSPTSSRPSSVDPPAAAAADRDERSFWAAKKAEKTKQLWENLHASRNVSVENAPSFGLSDAEDSDDEDVKPRVSSPLSSSSASEEDKKKKKSKKGKKHKMKKSKKSTRA